MLFFIFFIRSELKKGEGTSDSPLARSIFGLTDISPPYSFALLIYFLLILLPY